MNLVDIVKKTIKQISSVEDIPEDKLGLFADVIKEAEDAQQEYDTLKSKHEELKDKYINSITKIGSDKEPEAIGGATTKNPRSLEEIAQSLQSGKDD